MPRITRSALVNYSAEQMFNLVNDVRSYPHFVPGCSASEVLEQSENTMKASIEVAKAGISKTFITQNTLVVGESIEMALVNGPFSQLQGGWHFIHIDERACQIELNLEFEFKSLMIEMVFGKIFNELTISMVDAFIKRARVVYGERDNVAC